MPITDPVVLVTGASSGLGRELALRYGRRRCALVITARREERLREVAAEIEASGGRALVCPADATDTEACAAVVAAAVAEFGGIDIAILNAGGGTTYDMGSATAEQVLGTMRTNYDTFVNFLCPVIAHMKPRGAGTIAYTGSPAGYFGLPKSGPYSAAKAAGRVLFDTCRIELADTGIRLVALYPGFTDTEGLRAEDVPVKSLIISSERAGGQMIRAIERGTAHTMFPKRISFLMALARVLPEPIRRRILRVAGG